MEGKGDHYTVEEAARVLERTPGRIRQMLRAGELEGIPPEETEGRGWKIPAHAVHARDRTARVERPERPSESPERLQGLESEVRYLRYELGRSRGRLELTEKTESSLRERLEHERERADKEHERAEQLQAELEEARKGFWRRLFGG